MALSSAHVHLPHPKYSNREQYLQFANQTMSTLVRAPGVQAVAATVNLPFTEYSFAGEFMIPGQSHELGRELPLARLNSVSPRYFEAMGIPLLRGRSFTDADHAGASRVIVVNDVIAKKYFPNEDPLGKRIRPVRFGDAWREIIGIVGSVKPDNLQAPSMPELFEPFSVFPDNDIFFVVRTSGSVAALSGLVTRIRGLSAWALEAFRADGTGRS